MLIVCGVVSAEALVQTQDDQGSNPDNFQSPDRVLTITIYFSGDAFLHLIPHAISPHTHGGLFLLFGSIHILPNSSHSSSAALFLNLSVTKGWGVRP